MIDLDEQREEEQGKLRWRRVFNVSPKLLGLLLIVIIVAIIFFATRARSLVTPNPEHNIVELEEFREALNNTADPVIVDVRTARGDFEAGHLPDAIWNEQNDCFVYGVNTCERRTCEESKVYFFYSVKGEDYHEIRSTVNRESFRGCWKETWMLDGGFNAWSDAGLPVE